MPHAFFARLAWKNRILRHHLHMMRVRYLLATRTFNTGMGDSAWLLHGLVRSLRPQVCVEIGSAQGWSTCHIGLALRENFCGRLYAIDPHQPTQWNDVNSIDSLPILQRNLRLLKLEAYVEVVRRSSGEAARDWRLPIEFLLIDGDHSYEGVKRDWELFSRFVTPFGVVVFHDTTWDLHGPNRPDMGVPRLVDELRQAGYPVITLDRDCGLSVVQVTRGGNPLSPLSSYLAKPGDSPTRST